MDGIRTVKTNGSTIHHYTLNGSQIVTETWTTKSSSGAETPNHFLVYLYDENGAPVGLQYRNKSDAKNVFYTYYFEKNLQGDIIAIYTENGTKIGSYTYDAWGNCTVSTESGTTTIQKRIVRTLNPFRYRMNGEVLWFLKEHGKKLRRCLLNEKICSFRNNKVYFYSAIDPVLRGTNIFPYVY